jgi:hypothetical protein
MFIFAVYEWSEASAATAKAKQYASEAEQEGDRADTAEEQLAECPSKPRTPRPH